MGLFRIPIRLRHWQNRFLPPSLFASPFQKEQRNGKTRAMIRIKPALILIFWTLMAALHPCVADAMVSQLHLSWQQDPATTMTILWATEKDHAPPRVQYGTTPSYGNVAQGSDSAHGVVLHTVELTGLQADTRYHYRVSDDDDGWSEDRTFQTAPLPGQTGKDGLIVTVVGDKGPYGDAQAINAQIAAKNADFHIIVGDLAYSSDDTAFHGWLDKQQGYASSAPLMPAWGNHDTTEKDPPYSHSQAHFALPTSASDDERFYSYDVGNTHFAAVDSNTDNSTAPGSPQYQWLQKDLAEASKRSAIQWIVIYFHHNIYSAGGKYANTATPVRAHLQPLFDQYGVDLVLHGHTHYYARSMPVAYNEVVKNAEKVALYDFSGKDHGQVYITTGGGGKPLYPCPKDLPAFILRCDAVYSFGLLTIQGPRLLFQAFRSDGTLLDEGFTLSKPSNNANMPPRPSKNNKVVSNKPGSGQVGVSPPPLPSKSNQVMPDKPGSSQMGVSPPPLPSKSNQVMPDKPGSSQMGVSPPPLPSKSNEVMPDEKGSGQMGVSPPPLPSKSNKAVSGGKGSDGRVTSPPPLKSQNNTAVPVKPENKIPAPKGGGGDGRVIPSDDAMVHEAHPDQNYGRAARMEVDRIEEGGQQEIYLKFQVTDISEPITGAVLQLKTADLPFAGSDSAGLLYTVSDSSWTEDTLTWQNRPKRGIAPLSNHKEKGVGRSERVTWDLTGIVTRSGLYSFALASSSSNGVIYNTKESGAGEGERPMLIITWKGKP